MEKIKGLIKELKEAVENLSNAACWNNDFASICGEETVNVPDPYDYFDTIQVYNHAICNDYEGFLQETWEVIEKIEEIIEDLDIIESKEEAIKLLKEIIRLEKTIDICQDSELKFNEENIHWCIGSFRIHEDEKIKYEEEFNNVINCWHNLKKVIKKIEIGGFYGKK